MLTKTTVFLCFPQGASFQKDPALLIYQALLRLIKKVSCFHVGDKCCGCRDCGQCRYYWITGNNFAEYAGILCPLPLFGKKQYASDEVLEVAAYWIGSASHYSVFLEAALREMKNQLAGQTFYLQETRTDRVDLDQKISKQVLRISTPVEQLEIDEAVQQMLDFYQKTYDFCIARPDLKGEIVSSLPVRMDSVKLPTKRLRIDGITGIWKLKEKTEIPVFLFEIGIGKMNCLGGGHCETDY